jgi:hypothetical protein
MDKRTAMLVRLLAGAMIATGIVGTGPRVDFVTTLKKLCFGFSDKKTAGGPRLREPPPNGRHSARYTTIPALLAA